MDMSSDQHFALGPTRLTVILARSFADARRAHGGSPSSNPNSDHGSSTKMDDDNEAHGNARGEGNSSRPSVRVFESQGVE